MKAISLKQPWASLIAIGKKTIETRTWKTNYRGKLLIVASKTFDKNFPHMNFFSTFYEIPLGKALAVVNLVNCRPMKPEDEESAMCPCEPGRFAWILSDIKPVKPFSVKGQLGLYEVDYKESADAKE